MGSSVLTGGILVDGYTVHTMLTNNILLLLVGLAFLPPQTLAQNLMFKEKRSVEYEGKTISLWFKIFYVMEKGEPVFTRYGKRMSRVVGYPRPRTVVKTPITEGFTITDINKLMLVTFSGRYTRRGYRISSVVFTDPPPPTDPSSPGPVDPEDDATTVVLTDPPEDPATDPAKDPASDPAVEPSPDPVVEEETDPPTDPPTKLPEDPQEDPATQVTTDPPSDPTATPPEVQSKDPVTDEWSDRPSGPTATSTAFPTTPGDIGGRVFCKCKACQDDSSEESFVKYLVKRSIRETSSRARRSYQAFNENVDFGEMMRVLVDLWSNDELLTVLLQLVEQVQALAQYNIEMLMSEETGAAIGELMREVLWDMLGLKDGVIGVDCVCYSKMEDHDQFCM